MIIGDVFDDRSRAVALALPSARFVRLDVGSPEDWATVVQFAGDEFGSVDVLVNNPGVVHHASLVETTLADYERVVRVNQIGPFLGMQSVAPAMIAAAGGGSIVAISSVRNLSGANGLLAYTATKFAVRGMTKAIPRIGRPDDIALLALFLASDESSYCTGAEFVADDGASSGVRRPNSPGY